MAVGDLVKLVGFAAIHRQHEELRLAGRFGEERDPVATGGPLRRRDAVPVVRQRPALATHRIDQQQLRVEPVLR